ncbi:MAG: type II toxin-antitoxin system HicA family toxin [Cutibacterium granulosum]|nr:type II toxin-antitoxin system HicA family toxin [Cutibacterium granulosum]MEA5659260.1 type II toxin-antitoxin system HicA family toxin [Cutibacterium granulosum]MEA5660784.1 type II toxin-antitoxin system HicA family toxin [Cutibacterium granulosum]
MVKPMKYRDVAKLLSKAGFTKSRVRGDHERWDNGPHHITITHSREVSAGVVRQVSRRPPNEQDHDSESHPLARRMGTPHRRPPLHPVQDTRPSREADPRLPLPRRSGHQLRRLDHYCHPPKSTVTRRPWTHAVAPPRLPPPRKRPPQPPGQPCAICAPRD